MVERHIDGNISSTKLRTDQTGVWKLTDIMLNRYQLAEGSLISAIDEHDQRKLASSIVSVIGLQQTIIPFVNMDNTKEEIAYKKKLEDKMDNLWKNFEDLYVKQADEDTVVSSIKDMQFLIGESIKQMHKLGILVERNITGDTGGYNLD
jgi:hypothetical protein